MPPKNTSVAPVNPDPVMVTVCSPPGPEAPVFGETPVTVWEAIGGAFPVSWIVPGTDARGVKNARAAGLEEPLVLEVKASAATTALTRLTCDVPAARRCGMTVDRGGDVRDVAPIASPAKVAKHAPPKMSPRALIILLASNRSRGDRSGKDLR